jgi:hypothetical protein
MDGIRELAERPSKFPYVNRLRKRSPTSGPGLTVGPNREPFGTGFGATITVFGIAQS